MADWLGWGLMYHWTDSQIRVHAFYRMLGEFRCSSMFTASPRTPGPISPWNN